MDFYPWQKFSKFGLFRVDQKVLTYPLLSQSMKNYILKYTQIPITSVSKTILYNYILYQGDLNNMNFFNLLRHRAHIHIFQTLYMTIVNYLLQKLWVAEPISILEKFLWHSYLLHLKGLYSIILKAIVRNYFRINVLFICVCSKNVIYYII